MAGPESSPHTPVCNAIAGTIESVPVRQDASAANRGGDLWVPLVVVPVGQVPKTGPFWTGPYSSPALQFKTRGFMPR
jgi:hypothetical protein